MRRARPAARRGHGDEGVGLIEVLVAVGLLGFGFVSILGALAVVAQTSRTHEVTADANAVLVGAAEAVKGSEFCDPAASCNPVTTYEADLDAVDLPTGWDRDTIHIGQIRPVTGAGRLVQDITLQLVSPDGDVTDSLTVAKVAPPPPPTPVDPVPTDECTPATVTARAFSLIFFVIIEVTIPADAGACTAPIRAKVVGGPSVVLTANPSMPTLWSGVGFSGLCVGTCQIDILQGDGTLITTIAVESFF